MTMFSHLFRGVSLSSNLNNGRGAVKECSILGKGGSGVGGGEGQSSKCIPLTFPYPLLLVAARRTQSIAISILKQIHQ